jgi:hypothetical protein
MQHQHLRLLNQFFELEKKILKSSDSAGLQRPLDRMKDVFLDMGYQIHNPLGEPYSETRTDVEASVLGDAASNLKVVEVIKPIVYQKEEGRNVLLQKGVVLVSGE